MSEIGLPKTALDTPVLWVDLDALEKNIATLADHFARAGVNWRPHTKGIKTPAIVHRLLAAGAKGITCAKLGEAEVMAASGVDDILIANQIVSRQKIVRLVNLRRQVDVKVAIDNPDNVAAIGAAASEKGVEVGVLVEVNTGMNRAGVEPGAATVALAALAHATPGVRLRGLMTWEGHALEFTDPDEKRRAVEASIASVNESAGQCREAGLPMEIISGGGSGTYAITSFLAGVTEIQAGGGIFCDVTYEKWGVDLQPALFIQSTVTSRPTPDRVICDAGFKTLPRGFNTPQPVGLDVASYGLSAEHGIITLKQPDDRLRVGDVFDIRVGYGDATVFLHEHLYGIRDGFVESCWPVLGRGKLR